jgi:hypothetical protein
MGFGRVPVYGCGTTITTITTTAKFYGNGKKLDPFVAVGALSDPTRQLVLRDDAVGA